MPAGPAERKPPGLREVLKECAGRASAVSRTQREAVDRAREIVHNRGGGELAIKGADDKIRSKDTIAPSNDPPRFEGLTRGKLTDWTG
jgi:hypothetical protein